MNYRNTNLETSKCSVTIDGETIPFNFQQNVKFEINQDELSGHNTGYDSKSKLLQKMCFEVTCKVTKVED